MSKRGRPSKLGSKLRNGIKGTSWSPWLVHPASQLALSNWPRKGSLSIAASSLYQKAGGERSWAGNQQPIQAAGIGSTGRLQRSVEGVGTVLSNALNDMAPGLFAPNPVCHTLINFVVHFSSFQGPSQESVSDHLSTRNISVPCHVWFVHSDHARSFELISSLVLDPLRPRICNVIYVICTCYSISITPYHSFLERRYDYDRHLWRRITTRYSLCL